MKVTILGCGPSYGLPTAVTGFGDCNPNNPKNYRTRAGLFLSDKDTSVLIDTPPELRLQLVRENIKHIDAVLWTHLHSDHTAGIDDIKIFASTSFSHIDRTIDAFVYQKDADDFSNQYAYLLKSQILKKEDKPVLALSTFDERKSFKVKNLDFIPILQNHGKSHSIGFRVGDFAYNTDLVDLTETEFEKLKGIKTWVLGVCSYRGNSKHLTVEKALEYIEKLKPEKAYFTHMGATLDYDKLKSELPDGIEPAFDGLSFDV